MGGVSEPFVPIVDVSGWGSGDDVERQTIVRDVDNACRRVGFLQVVGHGIDPDIINEMLAAADEFFALPDADKGMCVAPSAEINRGYAPMGSEALSYSVGVQTPPDLFEAFNIGLEPVPDDAAHQARRHDLFVENIWPLPLPGWRLPLLRYFDEASNLARRLTSIFAVALDLPESFFVAKTDHSTVTMRVNNYVRQPGAPDPIDGQQRMGAHTDYGIVTVLYADRVAGLEILTSDGTWQGVIPEPGALLVNLGDLLAEWTNDRWRSTLHRVVPPPRSTSGTARRRSVAFFFDGNHDALVECLPSCVSVENPAKYPPVLAGDHLMAKLLGPRTLTNSAATVNTAATRLAPSPPNSMSAHL